MKKYIYLAGPIEGCNKSEANDWRTDICSKLARGIIGISPLRCETLKKKQYSGSANASAVVGKNYLDTVSCDLLLAYLPRELNERRPSYGTVWEIAWAHEMRKPIILVTDDLYVANHPLFSTNVSWIFDNFDDALDTIHGLFKDYV